MGPKIYLIGVGMGSSDSLTLEAQKAISSCTLLIGAERLLEPYRDRSCKALVIADEIVGFISTSNHQEIGVLLSGDTGFYSGATALQEKLSAYSLQTLPGISSLSYFCAKIDILWQDVKIVSAHGRSHNAVGEIQRNRRTFLLTDTRETPAQICRQLTKRGLGGVTVWIGEHLSYPQEHITKTTAAEAQDMRASGLAVMLVENPFPIQRDYTAPFLADSAFIRGKTPMTKEEVRVLALSRLRVKAEHVIWDVGAGSGSVSVELALAANAGLVYAIERDKEALELIAQNRDRFHLTNLVPVAGSAPEILVPLPAPDRVFLGGTAGQMEAILSCILNKNPQARVVAAAVTLETLQNGMRLFGEYGLEQIEMVQVAISRAIPVGEYHMVQANNPVWLISGEGKA